MRHQQLNDQEVVRRLPVWVALSDTFLDTQLDETNYRQIAEVIAEAGFDAVEAASIYYDEVVPAFAGNLMGVAGEWAGWSDDYVRDRVLKYRGSLYAGFLPKIILRRYYRDIWKRISMFL